ncbi:MAG TPA: DUF934 domain-containing protein [Rhodocyclaceae bacterium]|nr:DUF934 domain-containing protein [Rhodocyclaceae bacterium]
MSNFIRGNAIAEDDWQLIRLPAIEETIKKQAGKVVVFKLTGAASATDEQIASTEIPAGKVIVPLSIWLARKNEFAARVAAGELGVWLETHELIESLIADTPDVNIFKIIAVHFERFADGRGYSIATMLRLRYGYKNELRAFGDVLRDQLFLMKRCGFNAYQIRADRSAEDALPSLQDFSEPYQGAVDITQPLWRRHVRA